MDERIFDEAEKEARRARWWGGAVVVAILAGLIIFIGWPALHRARCGAYMVREMACLRELMRDHFAEVFEGRDEFRPMVVRFAQQKQPLPMFDAMCGKHRAGKIRFGRYTMADLLNDRISDAEATAEVRGVLGDPPGWESYETMGMCHDAAAWTTAHELIVAWIVDVYDRDDLRILIGFSNNMARAFRPDELSGLVDSHDRTAARLGIDPAPAELRAWCE